jgi:ABC-type antimicrobial peptide transport system permease subunit
VRNSKYSAVKQDPPPLYIRPYRQGDTLKLGETTFYVRTTIDPTDFMANVPKLVGRLDPNLPIEGLKTMPEQVRQSVFLDRLITVLSAAFACLATLLAAVGLYGVLAYTVAQRTREIGLRMALGAAPGRVGRMVLGQVGWMTAIGGPLGLAAAIAIGRLAESLLYQMKGWDPIVLVGSALGLTAVALVAGLIPALRASRVEPMQALRYE